MKKLMIGSLIGLAALVATLGLLGNGTVGAAGPEKAECFVNGVKQTGTIVGTKGDDDIDCRLSPVGARILGLGGDDDILGSDHNDIIRGGGGEDDIKGGKGDDFIDGGNGNDEITGGPGSDTLLGGNGSDEIDGDGGDDSLDGRGGFDICNGGSGTNTFAGCEKFISNGA